MSIPSRRRHRSGSPWGPALHRFADAASGKLLILALVFAPWAFGATEDWSIWTLNVLGYVLGLLLIVKCLACRFGGCRPARWNDRFPAPARPGDGSPAASGSRAPRLAEAATILLAVLSIGGLGYCLVSALNARAIYGPRPFDITYLDCVAWLPHSYDRHASWQAFWMYLAWALFFWSARDWFLLVPPPDRPAWRSWCGVPAGYGLDTDEGSTSLADEGSRMLAEAPSRHFLPHRVRRLLVALCLSSGVLAAEGILQRQVGGDKLLFLVEPRFHGQVGHFGPFAYRGTASTYLNLLWPACLGLAWLQAKESRRLGRLGFRRTSRLHLVTFICGVLMVGGVLVSTARGGILIALALLLAVALAFLVAARRSHRSERIGILLVCFLTLQLGVAFGWDQMTRRFSTAFTDNLSGRITEWHNVDLMLKDHPLFGVGPGAFGSQYQFYRSSLDEEWAAYGHDDWLEVRATFGLVGFGLVVPMLFLVPWNWLVGQGLRLHWLLPTLIGMSMCGCLLHARFDFPFRIYSVALTFLTLCAMFTCLGRAREPSPAGVS